MLSEKTRLLRRSESDTLPSPSTCHRDKKDSWSTLRLAIILFSCMILLRAVLLVNFLTHPWSTRHTGDRHLAAARRILADSPLIDGHNDFLIMVRGLYGNHIYDDDFRKQFEQGGLPGHVDIPRIKEGQLGGSFWSAFMPCPANGSDFSDEAYAPYVRATLQQFDLFSRLTTLYPDLFTPTPSVSAARAAFKSHRLISPLGIEGLHQIGNSPALLRLYHALGARYATLTWNCHNRYADAALVANATGHTIAAPPLHNGVSPAGRALIHEMNRLGMLVDLSHVSVATMRDVLSGSPDASSLPQSSSANTASWTGSLAPAIFSHSSVHALCPHPRNVPDDVLRLLARNRGVVMINFAPDFVSCDEGDTDDGLPRFVNETNTLEHVVDHVVYVGELIGYEHVGLGSDFDGIESTPRGLEGVNKYPELVAELLRRGVGEEEVRGVAGGNVLRVWEEAERVSARMKEEGWEPLEDEVEKWRWD